MIRIYTDGSYKPTTDQGGYASIITEDNKVIKIYIKVIYILLTIEQN